MRQIAISDIHGCAAELDLLLKKTKAQPEEVIFLGDYVDSGPDSIKVLDMVSEWCSQGATALLGNHDDLFLQWLEEKENLLYYGGRNGGMATINSCLHRLGMDRIGFSELLKDIRKENQIRKVIKERFQSHISFVRSLPLFKKDGELIFVHAGISPINGLEKTTKLELLHLRDEFIYGYNKPETVIFGHTLARKIHNQDNVYFGSNRVIGIDGGCAFGGQLNALIINNGEFSTETVGRLTKEE
ncbi:serine/threonine protein phosphatase 1 [Mesobacillus persicus]|uniref:Serine/threonine protein phosphatase 1 n=1 Tax=Mesobacillus persicus TaxID=930146 RepID=A0A1H7Z1P1_9BACI|nr:metallophosphoesterase [Mesobacillus persicus]SEM52135.1 serine/threonine protein phosphatase 1 [Mesobacillus persicus]